MRGRRESGKCATIIVPISLHTEGYVLKSGEMRSALDVEEIVKNNVNGKRQSEIFQGITNHIRSNHLGEIVCDDQEDKKDETECNF